MTDQGLIVNGSLIPKHRTAAVMSTGRLPCHRISNYQMQADEVPF